MVSSILVAACPEPGDTQSNRIADLYPTNPFCSNSYRRARAEIGWRPWALSVEKNGAAIAGCYAFSRRGRLGGTLEIPSFPALHEPGADVVLMNELVRLCRRQGLHYLKVNSFGSDPLTLVTLPGEVRRTSRREWLLDLQGDDPASRLDTKHVQSIKRARKTGLVVRLGNDRDACEAHARMCAASMAIRANRGETVSGAFDTSLAQAFTRGGAGIVFQAVLGSEVLSSMLVLFATAGAYEQTSGTSVDGRAIGASHFLLHEVSVWLRQRRFRIFNLGGAGQENPGLARFKARFGARPVDLEAAEGIVAGPAARIAALLRRIVSRGRD